MDNKLVPAANARFMEILVDNWLVHNAKTEANGLETAHFVDFDSMQSVIEEETNASSPSESFQDSYIKTQLHSESRENDKIYLVWESALERLFRHFIDGNYCVCKCGKSLDFATFKVQRITKNNHCCKVTVECKAEEGHTLECFRLPFHKAEKQTSEKPSFVWSPEKLPRANFTGVRHTWVNKPIKAEYSNL